MYRVKKIFILLFIIIIILIGYYIPLFITKSPPIVTINNKLYYTYSKELEIPPFTIFSEKDISSLKYMKWLKVISISVENLNDISFFSQMNNLEEIYFTNLDCQINDWKPIENCINLKSFSRTFLKFNDLECFSTLNDLKYLCLLDCEVKDISGIENLKASILQDSTLEQVYTIVLIVVFTPIIILGLAFAFLKKKKAKKKVRIIDRQK